MASTIHPKIESDETLVILREISANPPRDAEADVGACGRKPRKGQLPA